jgi:high-affinity Fe2+/Pb2+ permease
VTGRAVQRGAARLGVAAAVLSGVGEARAMRPCREGTESRTGLGAAAFLVCAALAGYAVFHGLRRAPGGRSALWFLIDTAFAVATLAAGAAAFAYLAWKCWPK